MGFLLFRQPLLDGLGGRFATDSLHYPTSLDFSTWDKVPKRWMMLSLIVGLGLLISVCVELILRSLLTLVGRAANLIEIPHTVMGGAE